MLGKGDAAADFELKNERGETVGLAALLEKGPLVLFFYVADFTPG